MCGVIGSKTYNYFNNKKYDLTGGIDKTVKNDYELLYLMRRVNLFVWREHYKIRDCIDVKADMGKGRVGWDYEEMNNLIKKIKNYKEKVDISIKSDLDHSLRSLITVGQLTNYINKDVLQNATVFEELPDDIHDPLSIIK